MELLRHQTKIAFLIGLHLTVYGLFWVVLSPVYLGWQAVILAGLLIWVSVWDFRTFEIPDTASALLLITGLVFTFGAGDLLQAALSAVLWAGVFLAIAVGFSTLRGVDGLGLGDVKLMAGIGAWLGPFAPVYVVLSAALSAIVTLLVVAVMRENKSPISTKTGIAFGPFLCLSAWAVWISSGGIK
ncbi:Type IV leader peptidase family protein [Aliiroseovarius halocynthiae]|nr:A24 family peptidase [Aliiroseovarius halocynthiae]SMR83572.1 Type IV leader peptidase family protein [Aliiroseovarius halocynthiae]